MARFRENGSYEHAHVYNIFETLSANLAAKLDYSGFARAYPRTYMCARKIKPRGILCEWLIDAALSQLPLANYVIILCLY